MGKKGGGKKDKKATSFDYQRKLGPVYEYLDHGNPKAALKLLQSYVQKYGKIELVLALLSLAYLRSGKKKEAMEVGKELQEMVPLDTGVLSTMALVYRSANELQESTAMYAEAVKKMPKNYELMQEHKFKQQQQVAMQLYTTFKQEKFLFYSATNLLLEYKQGTEDPNAAKLMQLAQLMIMRGVPKDKPLTAEQCVILVKLLCRQGKQQEAIDLIHGPYGKTFFDDNIERRRLLGELYKESGRMQEERDVYHDLLTGENCQPSDWFYLCRFIETDFALTKSKGAGVSQMVAGALSVVQQLQQQELAGEGEREGGEVQVARRGPFLAECQVYYCALQQAHSAGGDGESEWQSKLEESLVQYYERFGTKHCFFMDVRRYVYSLPPALQSSLCAAISAFNQRSKTSDAKGQVTGVYRAIALSQLKRFCSLDVDRTQDESTVTTALKERATQLYSLYQHSLQLSSGSLEPTERGVGDPLLVLVCHTLYEVFERTQQRGHLVDAICVLERALAHDSKHNFQFKLLLVRLYCHPTIGCISRAFQVFKSLDVKQIQLDTLSHLIVSDCVRYAQWQPAIDLTKRALNFHHMQRDEEPEQTSRAYIEETYTQVLEFQELQRRLDNSHMKAVCEAELNHLTGVMAASKELDSLRNLLLTGSYALSFSDYATTAAEEAEQQLQACVANEDYSVLFTHEPEGASLATRLNRPAQSLSASSFALPFDELLAKGEGEETYQIDTASRHFLRFRRCVARMLWSFMMEGPNTDTTTPINTDVNRLRGDLLEYKQQLEAMQHATIATSTAAAATATASPQSDTQHPLANLQSFDDYLWNAGFLVLETSCSVVETSERSRVWLEEEGKEEEQTKLEQLQQQWAQVQRSFTALTSLLNHLKAHLSPSAPTAEDVSIDPRQVTELAAFLAHTGHWLVVCLQVWAERVPTKRTLKKSKKSAKTKEVDMQAMQTLETVRESLRGVIWTTKSCYQQVKAWCERVLERPEPLPVDPEAQVFEKASDEEGGGSQQQATTQEAARVSLSVNFGHSSLFEELKADQGYASNLVLARVEMSLRASVETLGKNCSEALHILTKVAGV